MSGPRLAGGPARRDALAALADGRVIAVPGAGGYQLAARLDHAGLLARPLGSVVADSAVHVMVGTRGQALGLASEWTNEARLLTDRMWPGPLIIVVPAGHDGPAPAGSAAVVSLTMPASRALRALCREGGPLAAAGLRHADGRPLPDPGDVTAWCSGDEIALVLHGGTCAGPEPTVVDCTVSPPVVRHVGARPESYVDAALMMGRRRRRWRATRDDAPTGDGDRRPPRFRA